MQAILLARRCDVAFEVMSCCDMALQALTFCIGHLSCMLKALEDLLKLELFGRLQLGVSTACMHIECLLVPDAPLCQQRWCRSGGCLGGTWQLRRCFQLCSCAYAPELPVVDQSNVFEITVKCMLTGLHDLSDEQMPCEPTLREILHATKASKQLFAQHVP